MSLDFADTSYTAQSKLAMARLYMDLNRDQDAADVLHQLLAMSGHDELKNVGRLRLAKIMLYQDRPQDVIELLDGEGGSAFAAQYAEVMGDAHATMGDFAAAEQAYQAVLADAEQSSVDRNIVQMKLIDLPDTTAMQAAAPAPEVPVDDALDVAAADPEADAESDTGAEAEVAE
jgi:predicted negative regulator of RcsB-dependent stress response